MHVVLPQRREQAALFRLLSLLLPSLQPRPRLHTVCTGTCDGKFDCPTNGAMAEALPAFSQFFGEMAEVAQP